MTAPLLISHIPKTAGTSLLDFVKANAADPFLVYDAQLALGSPDIEFIQAFRVRALPDVIMGHFSHGVHRLLGVAPRYASVFRDPIDRVVSLYRHQLRLPGSRFAAQLAAGMGLEEFVTSGITEMTNNHMCRIVAGIPPDAGMMIHDDWLLDLALHNLRRHYLLVGVQEHVDAFAAALAVRQGWAVDRLSIANAAETRPESLPPQTWDAIASHNLLDIRLYQHVLAISEDRGGAPN